MKAKIKGTPFEVDVQPCHSGGQFAGFVDIKTQTLFYNLEDLEFEKEKEFDWEAYRREVAKDIICAILSTGMEQTDDDDKHFHSFEELAKASVRWADELIRQLKEK